MVPMCSRSMVSQPDSRQTARRYEAARPARNIPVSSALLFVVVSAGADVLPKLRLPDPQQKLTLTRNPNLWIFVDLAVSLSWEERGGGVSNLWLGFPQQPGGTSASVWSNAL